MLVSWNDQVSETTRIIANAVLTLKFHIGQPVFNGEGGTLTGGKDPIHSSLIEWFFV